MQFSFSAILVTLSLSASFAAADLNSGSCSDAQKSKVVTNHTAKFGNEAVSYTTTAGFLEVIAKDHTTKACVFYVAYEMVQPNSPPRPLTFAFNGGPGSSSVWLHLGLLGPKRVDMGDHGLTPPQNTALISNESSLLPLTDFVMIDPVATGFSTSLGGPNNDKFFGVKNDYTSIAEFVRNYLNVNNRWQSPKFILGESYGGIRGSLLTNYLQNQMNIRIDGLVMISPALSKTSFFMSADNLVPYWASFPSFAGTAWYHHKIAPRYQQLPLGQVFQLAKAFATSRLKPALDLGADLPEEDMQKLAQEASDFLGIPAEEIFRRQLRIDDSVFFVKLLEQEHRYVGRYDGRFTEVATARYEDDPSGSIPAFAYAAGINDYLRTDLGVLSPSPYNIFGDVPAWAFEGPDEGWDAITAISQSLAVNPRLKIFVASGYYDLACPMETVSFVLRQIPNAAFYKQRILHGSYDGGHMMYINPEALKSLSADLTLFYKMQTGAATGAGPALLRQPTKN